MRRGRALCGAQAQRLKELSTELENKKAELEVERNQEHSSFEKTITESLISKSFRESGATFNVNDPAELVALLSEVAHVKLNDDGVGLKVRDKRSGRMTTQDAIEKIVLLHPELVDHKSLSPRLGALIDLPVNLQPGKLRRIRACLEFSGASGLRL